MRLIRAILFIVALLHLCASGPLYAQQSFYRIPPNWFQFLAITIAPDLQVVQVQACRSFSSMGFVDWKVLATIRNLGGPAPEGLQIPVSMHVSYDPLTSVITGERLHPNSGTLFDQQFKWFTPPAPGKFSGVSFKFRHVDHGRHSGTRLMPKSIGIALNQFPNGNPGALVNERPDGNHATVSIHGLDTLNYFGAHRYCYYLYE